METVIGVIGGSGLYEIPGLEEATWQQVDSPWGTPSDAILTGRLDGIRLAFLPRHGRGHVHSPTTVPYRANIDALKRLGVTDVISVSACGSFREELAPGDFLIVDQFIASAEKKWERSSGLTLFLPHGAEGLGPEHSSARLERFLQLCADDNMVVCSPTRASQIFHLIRRQMNQPFRKPLVVMTPKSMLRLPA